MNQPTERRIDEAEVLVKAHEFPAQWAQAVKVLRQNGLYYTANFLKDMATSLRVPKW